MKQENNSMSTQPPYLFPVIWLIILGMAFLGIFWDMKGSNPYNNGAIYLILLTILLVGIVTFAGIYLFKLFQFKQIQLQFEIERWKADREDAYWREQQKYSESLREFNWEQQQIQNKFRLLELSKESTKSTNKEIKTQETGKTTTLTKETIVEKEEISLEKFKNLLENFPDMLKAKQEKNS